MVVVENRNGDPKDKPKQYIQDRYLSSLVAVLEDVTSKTEEERRKVIINMSFGWTFFHDTFISDAHFSILCNFVPLSFRPLCIYSHLA